MDSLGTHSLECKLPTSLGGNKPFVELQLWLHFLVPWLDPHPLTAALHRGGSQPGSSAPPEPLGWGALSLPVLEPPHWGLPPSLCGATFL